MTGQPARIHSCGLEMNHTVLKSNVGGSNSQPIWSCRRCSAWEPHETWQGDLPDGWDGQKWTEGDR